MTVDINILLESKEDFVTCFEIHLQGMQKLFLTSANRKITINEVDYLPYSGLNLCSFELNDSAHNYIKLKGIFEDKGINNRQNLDGAIIKILFYFTKRKLLLEWIEYNFSKIEHDGQSFEISLISEIFKLQKSLLQNYSTNCRAAFGDNKCRIDKYIYSDNYDIMDMQNSELRITRLNKPDGFYTNGKAIFDSGIEYDIICHKGSTIILSNALYCDIKKEIKVILTPGCDKTITTCCNNYGNAINFRGEPFMQ
jgi:uncharacterized phage protein (TIGR02218 family)